MAFVNDVHGGAPERLPENPDSEVCPHAPCAWAGSLSPLRSCRARGPDPTFEAFTLPSSLGATMAQGAGEAALCGDRPRPGDGGVGGGDGALLRKLDWTNGVVVAALRALARQGCGEGLGPGANAGLTEPCKSCSDTVMLVAMARYV